MGLPCPANRRVRAASDPLRGVDRVVDRAYHAAMAPDAEELNRIGNELKDAGRWTDAEASYRHAVMASPDWPPPWFNLGLLFKLSRRWEDSAICSERATELDPDDEGAWWNLGIAATALGDWPRARRAWRGCGIDVPEGDGPPILDYGPIPIRLQPEGPAEVVWCDRIDPARAVVRSVPLPASGYHELDVLLHDGEPRGYRVRGGRQLPVFDALEILERSDRETFEASVVAADQREIDALQAVAESLGLTIEDWTATVRPLCRRCSEGVPHDVHDDPALPPWEEHRRVGVSASGRHEAGLLLARWTTASPGRRAAITS